MSSCSLYHGCLHYVNHRNTFCLYAVVSPWAEDQWQEIDARLTAIFARSSDARIREIFAGVRKKAGDTTRSLYLQMQAHPTMHGKQQQIQSDSQELIATTEKAVLRKDRARVGRRQWVMEGKREEYACWPSSVIHLSGQKTYLKVPP